MKRKKIYKFMDYRRWPIRDYPYPRIKPDFPDDDSGGCIRPPLRPFPGPRNPFDPWDKYY